MSIRSILMQPFELGQDLTGIYPGWKLECLEVTRQKAKTHNQRIAEISGIHLNTPLVEFTRQTRMACYFGRTQTVGIESSGNNLRRLFPNSIDYVLVHELSHHLWENTPGRIPFREGGEVGQMWVEGFAEFLQYNYFADLVPINMNNRLANSRIYREGYFRAVYIAIFKEDPRAVYQIPVQWKKFEEEYQRHRNEESSGLDLEILEWEASGF